MGGACSIIADSAFYAKGAGCGRKMETANKEQAMVCLRKAEKAKAAGDLEKSRRMAEKSLKLCPTDNQKAKGERESFQFQI